MKTADLEHQFNQVKEKLLLDWENFYLQQSYLISIGSLPNLIINKSFESSEKRDALAQLDYAKFKEYQQNWMKTGKTVWFVCGNYGHDEAVELVEKARAKMQLGKLEYDYS